MDGGQHSSGGARTQNTAADLIPRRLKLSLAALLVNKWPVVHAYLNDRGSQYPADAYLNDRALELVDAQRRSRNTTDIDDRIVYVL